MNENNHIISDYKVDYYKYNSITKTWSLTMNKMTKKQIVDKYNQLLSDNNINKQEYQKLNTELRNLKAKFKAVENAYLKAEMRRNALEYAITCMHLADVYNKHLANDGYKLKYATEDKISMAKGNINGIDDTWLAK